MNINNIEELTLDNISTIEIIVNEYLIIKSISLKALDDYCLSIKKIIID